jgi:hypothetical protein
MSSTGIPRTAPRPLSRFAKAGVLFGSLVLTLGVAEYVVRVLSCCQAEVGDFELVRKRFLGDRLSIFPQLGDATNTGLKPGTQIDGRMHINALGFRGRETTVAKPLGTVRVLFLGGSAVFSSTVRDDTQTWPAVVERVARQCSKRVEVLNGGVPGFVAEQSITRFEKLFLPLSIDVAVLYNDHNDMISRRIACLEYDPREEAPVPVRNAFEQVLSHSAIWLRWRAFFTYREKQSNVKQRIESADHGAENEVERRQRMRDELVAKAATEARELEAGSSNPYFSTADLDKHEANLMRFLNLCRENGITPVLATESLSFDLDAGEQVYARKGASLLSLYFPNYAWFHEMANAYHQRIESVAKRENALFLATAKRMPHGDEMFVDHVHQTVAGCDALGVLVARALIEAKLLPVDGVGSDPLGDPRK